MSRHIEGTAFGSITIDGRVFPHDVIIRVDGELKKRKKKLSKRIYGTSHTLSLDEAKYIYQKGCPLLIIGTGQYDSVRLSDEAKAYFRNKECKVRLKSTPEAIQSFNETKGKKIGLFHVTC